jgi:hypothetical protein
MTCIKNFDFIVIAIGDAEVRYAAVSLGKDIDHGQGFASWTVPYRFAYLIPPPRPVFPVGYWVWVGHLGFEQAS